jgi:hypothetical protein
MFTDLEAAMDRFRRCIEQRNQAEAEAVSSGNGQRDTRSSRGRGRAGGRKGRALCDLASKVGHKQRIVIFGYRRICGSRGTFVLVVGSDIGRNRERTFGTTHRRGGHR